MTKQFRDFKEAREFVRKLNIVSVNEWNKYRKSGNKPEDIPSNPNNIYKNKGWITWGDYLGNGNVSDNFKQYCSFTEARKYVQNLSLKNQKEWLEYCKSGNKPDDIPGNPGGTYKKEWVSLGNWLGTGRIADRDKIFRPFKEARAFVSELNLKGQKEWLEYCKSGNKPDDIPTGISSIYKDKGWISWGNFLGNGTIAPKNRIYHSFEESREFVQSLGLKSKKEWIEYYHSGNKPDNIPTNPEKSYKGKGWISFGDWLGTGKTRNWRNFKEAREFVRKLGLKNQEGWIEYCKSGSKPPDIPNTVGKVYKKEWQGYGDWLGTGTIQTQQRKYRPYKEAKEFVRSLKIKNLKEWNRYSVSGNKPDDIPAAPWNTYKEWGKK
jgi:hypothetical protein